PPEALLHVVVEVLVPGDERLLGGQRGRALRGKIERRLDDDRQRGALGARLPDEPTHLHGGVFDELHDQTTSSSKVMRMPVFVRILLWVAFSSRTGVTV